MADPQPVTIFVHGTYVPWYRKLWRWITRWRPDRGEGSDRYGDGSREQPYETMRRAIRDVPLVLEPGQRFVVDLTDLKESIGS